MSETGFVCPKCGHTKSFEAYDVIMRCDLEISTRGSFWRGHTDDRINLDTGTTLQCGKCGYEGTVNEFKEEE